MDKIGLSQDKTKYLDREFPKNSGLCQSNLIANRDFHHFYSFFSYFAAHTCRRYNDGHGISKKHYLDCALKII